MVIRVDVECKEGHRRNDVMVSFDPKVGGPEFEPCSYGVIVPALDGVPETTQPCDEPVEQVFDQREQTEGYWVMRGRNW
jgi:hypothetical protein